MSKVVDVRWTNSLVEMASAFQFNISAMDTRIVTIKVMRILGCVKVKYNPQVPSQDESHLIHKTESIVYVSIA